MYADLSYSSQLIRDSMLSSTLNKVLESEASYYNKTETSAMT